MEPSSVTERVEALARPVAERAGLEVFDVQYRSENGRMVLRVLFDREAGGVTLDDLAGMSRQLGDVLDVHDVVPGRYHLECSSPGVERPLRHPRHFAAAVGQRVRIRLRELLDGRRKLRGTLEAVSPETITLRDDDDGSLEVPIALISEARTEFEFGRPRPIGGRS